MLLIDLLLGYYVAGQMDVRTCTFTPVDGQPCGAVVDDPLLFCRNCLHQLHHYPADYLRRQRIIAAHAAAVANGVAIPYSYRGTATPS